MDRPRKIVFTWIVDEGEEANPSTVTLTIQRESLACVATIIQEMDAQWADCVSRTESGQARMLHEVERLLAGR